jgi:hypothetical protein
MGFIYFAIFFLFLNQNEKFYLPYTHNAFIRMKISLHLYLKKIGFDWAYKLGMVGHICNPSDAGGISRRVTVQASQGKKCGPPSRQ